MIKLRLILAICVATTFTQALGMDSALRQDPGKYPDIIRNLRPDIVKDLGIGGEEVRIVEDFIDMESPLQQAIPPTAVVIPPPSTTSDPVPVVEPKAPRQIPTELKPLLKQCGIDIDAHPELPPKLQEALQIPEILPMLRLMVSWDINIVFLNQPLDVFANSLEEFVKHPLRTLEMHFQFIYFQGMKKLIGNNPFMLNVFLMEMRLGRQDQQNLLALKDAGLFQLCASYLDIDRITKTFKVKEFPNPEHDTFCKALGLLEYSGVQARCKTIDEYLVFLRLIAKYHFTFERSDKLPIAPELFPFYMACIGGNLERYSTKYEPYGRLYTTIWECVKQVRFNYSAVGRTLARTLPKFPHWIWEIDPRHDRNLDVDYDAFILSVQTLLLNEVSFYPRIIRKDKERRKDNPTGDPAVAKRNAIVAEHKRLVAEHEEKKKLERELSRPPTLKELRYIADNFTFHP